MPARPLLETGIGPVAVTIEMRAVSPRTKPFMSRSRGSEFGFDTYVLLLHRDMQTIDIVLDLEVGCSKEINMSEPNDRMRVSMFAQVIRWLWFVELGRPATDTPIPPLGQILGYMHTW